jgi:hypothetical protein
VLALLVWAALTAAYVQQARQRVSQADSGWREAGSQGGGRTKHPTGRAGECQVSYRPVTCGSANTGRR